MNFFKKSKKKSDLSYLDIYNDEEHKCSKSKCCKGSRGKQGMPGPKGEQGISGIEGPALFTLINVQGNSLITSNSIIINSSNITIVKTIENYYTAFITFKLNSANLNGESSVGFVSNNFINTFSFAFQFNTNNTFTPIYNRSGGTLFYSFSDNDLFTICLTSSTCKFFQNGNLIYNVITNMLYLNVFSQFYINGNINLSNISYGYLNDQFDVITYTYNDGNVSNNEGYYFLNLSNSSTLNTIYINSFIDDDCYISLPIGIYNITLTYNSQNLLNDNYSIYYTYDKTIFNQIGSGIYAGTSGSNNVIINLVEDGFIGIGTNIISSTPLVNSFNLSINKLM